MSTPTSYKEGLPLFLQNAINNEIKKATEEELEKAKKRIEKRKSEIVTSILLHVQRTINIEQMKDNLIITIRNEK